MNYGNYPIGTRVESLDSHGYFIMPLCGTIEAHLGEGHAIIKSVDGGLHYSTMSFPKKVAEIINLSSCPVS